MDLSEYPSPKLKDVFSLQNPPLRHKFFAASYSKPFRRIRFSPELISISAPAHNTSLSLIPAPVLSDDGKNDLLNEFGTGLKTCPPIMILSFGFSNNPASHVTVFLFP